MRPSEAGQQVRERLWATDLPAARRLLWCESYYTYYDNHPYRLPLPRHLAHHLINRRDRLVAVIGAVSSTHKPSLETRRGYEDTPLQ